MLAFDPTQKTITGFYESQGGGADNRPSWKCAFYFVGNASGMPPWSIIVSQVWDASRNSKISTLPGQIQPSASALGQGIQLTLSQQPPGCFFADPLVKGAALPSALEEKKPWLQIRMVSAPKTRFYLSDRGARTSGAYLVRGDVVSVDQVSRGRIHATYTSEKRSTTGWLLEKDMIPLRRPRSAAN